SQQGDMASVYVQGSDGVLFYPFLQSFDPSTGQATFLMLDRLPPGAYALHLSGPLGLADFAGNPLAGNDPSGDYVAPFRVGGTGARPHSAPGANAPALPQDLGVLFPHELTGSAFTIALDDTANRAGVPPGGAASYRFELLQTQYYFFLWRGASPPAGVQLTLTDASGATVSAAPQADGVSL